MSNDNNDILEFSGDLQPSNEEQEVLNKWRIKIMEEMYNELKVKVNEVIQSVGRPARKDFNNDALILENCIEYDLESERIDFKDYTVSTILGKYLEERGITKTWLSERTGINRVTLLNIINNPNTVTLINAFKIAKALGKDINELFECKYN